ncbi:MFS transporter [Saccharopolyspora erythraea]|uniref:MFS transporter n=1 Tax=Saccharopolyspora erythraea TaxID=1836 RepID=UPI001BA96E00|nr:MFS transporter [Saccharopolyspora erythraea]QUH02157.1 MFS transporter [Saccharopolyspora erythraea]
MVSTESQAGAGLSSGVFDARLWGALIVIASAVGLDVSSVAIVNAALPDIGAKLDIGPDTLQWVMTSYAVTFAGFLLFGGRLADVFDQRLVFTCGVGLFAASALVITVAPNAAVLMVARGAQGVGAAISVPAAMTLLTQTFPEGPARNKALGIYASVGAASFGAGLVLGGILADLFGWRSVFAVNVVLGIAVVAGAQVLLAKGTRHHRPLDVPGAVLITGGLLLVVFAITRGGQVGWTSLSTAGALCFGLALLVAFVVWERRVAVPLLPAELLSRRPVRAGAFAGLLFFGAVNGLLFFAPLYMQGLLGWEPLLSALAMLPMSVVVIISSNFAGRILDRVGQRRLMLVGLAMIGCGVALWIPTPLDGVYWWHMLPGLVVMSTGQGLAYTGLTAAALSGLPQEQHGVAGAFNITTQQVGSGLATASLVVIAAAARPDAGPAGTLSGYHAAYVAAVAGVAAGVALIALLPAFRYGADEIRQPS